MEDFRAVKECVKCGRERFVGDTDCDGNTYEPQGLEGGKVIPEHIVVKCRNCGFEWDEYCKDASDL